MVQWDWGWKPSLAHAQYCLRVFKYGVKIPAAQHKRFSSLCELHTNTSWWAGPLALWLSGLSLFWLFRGSFTLTFGMTWCITWKFGAWGERWWRGWSAELSHISSVLSFKPKISLRKLLLCSKIRFSPIETWMCGATDSRTCWNLTVVWNMVILLRFWWIMRRISSAFGSDSVSWDVRSRFSTLTSNLSLCSTVCTAVVLQRSSLAQVSVTIKPDNNATFRYNHEIYYYHAI